MSYDLFTGDPTDEFATVAYLRQLFHYARANRVNFEVQWEEAASLIWPEYRNSWSFGHVRAPGVKYTQYQVDSSASLKAHRFMCIADALITPFNMVWSTLTAPQDHKDLLKDRAAREYYEHMTKALWRLRYAPRAGFQMMQQTNWKQLAVFGNQPALIEEYDKGPMNRIHRGPRYLPTSVGEIYVLANHQGVIDGYIRHFRWNARQAYAKWPETIAKAPILTAALEKGDSYTLFDFLEFVLPRTDYDPKKIFTDQAKPWSSIYISIPGFCLLERGGYRKFPLAYGRYSVAPEEWYGRGPTQQALPELKTKNAGKEAYLKQAKLAGDPAFLLPEDGMFDFKTESGSFNYGGLNAETGRPNVGVVPTGQIQITKEMMEDCDRNIDGAFLNDLFPMLFDMKRGNIQRSAREVVEVANQVGIFLAPTLGPQFGYIGEMIARELDIASYAGLLPEMPPSVREAGGLFEIDYTSPLGRALKGQGIAGYMRTVEMAKEIAQSTGRDDVYDHFAFERAIPEIASQQFAPVRWMATMQEIQAKQKQRQAAQKAEQDMKSLPGRAAIMKAQAISQKAAAGQNIGGTLSGTPEGGMPFVPPQT